MCKKIHRGGGVEQYHADKKYKEAVAKSVETWAHADEGLRTPEYMHLAVSSKGKVCYVCGRAVHTFTGEGLVRECTCRLSGFAHVSCLVTVARSHAGGAAARGKGTYDKDAKDLVHSLRRWLTCKQCKQEYRGAVGCAMAWAYWAEYCGTELPVSTRTVIQMDAMSFLARKLLDVDRRCDARLAYEALIATLRADSPKNEKSLLRALEGVKTCYARLGWTDDALDTAREIWGLRSHLGPNYSRHLGRTAQEIFEAALNHATALISKNHFHEAKNLLCEAVNASEVQLGRYHITTIEIKHGYAQALWGYHFYGHDGYRDDLRNSIEMLEKLWTLPDEIRPPHVKSTDPCTKRAARLVCR